MPFLIVIIIILIIGGIIASYLHSAKRKKDLSMWAFSKGLSFHEGRDHGIDNRYHDFACLRKGSKRYAYNISEGVFSGRPVIAFDYHYETYSTNSKGHRQTHHYYFSAVIIENDYPLKRLFIRPENFFDKIKEFVGFNDIDFESAEFSRKFYVNADEKRWAYDVIHQRTMEFMLGMPQYTIEFEGYEVIAYRSSRFRVADFDSALILLSGILDRIPEYAVRQMQS